MLFKNYFERRRSMTPNVRAWRSARPQRFISPCQPKAESSTKDEDKNSRSVYNVSRN